MRAGLVLALALAATSVFGCAVFDEKNRRLLNLMDEGVQPESTAAKVALSPVGVSWWNRGRPSPGSRSAGASWAGA